MEIETWQKPHLALLAADVVLFARGVAGFHELHVLLIKRAENPYAGSWALPGGLVDVDKRETFEAAARRELFEETGITAPTQLTQVGVYDDPTRDARHRVISVAFTGFLPRVVTPTAGDDAEAVAWRPWQEVYQFTPLLAFDHLNIVVDAFKALPRDLRA